MLLVREIYPAVMGESRHSGWPCALVRLTGCHRRCVYCDTADAFQGGEKMTVDQVVDRVRDLGYGMMLLTGGEPLLQPEAADLMRRVMADGRQVVLETSGTVGIRLALRDVPAGVCRVVDIKTPGSGIDATQIDWDGLTALGADDEIKIVITDRRDYEWTRELIGEGLSIDGRLRRVPVGVPVTLSPGWDALPMRDLAGWILTDRLPVRFQVQLHKVVWPEAEGGV